MIRICLILQWLFTGDITVHMLNCEGQGNEVLHQRSVTRLSGENQENDCNCLIPAKGLAGVLDIILYNVWFTLPRLSI